MDRDPPTAARGGGPRRVEPRIDGGRLASMRLSRPAPADAGHARPAWWWWAVAALGVAMLVLLVVRKPLADRLWPETRAQQLRLDAAQALVEGRLTAPDGSGARELYEAARALEPDRLEAREGLAQVGEAALRQAEAAVDGGRPAEAWRALELARQMHVPRARLDQVEARLRLLEMDAADVDQWLVGADSARVAGQLVGTADAALPLYERVLAVQPDRVEALEGREDALSALVRQAWTAMDEGALARAGRLLRLARGYDAGHVELPDALAELARRGEQLQQDAARALAQRRLPQAQALWSELLAADPANTAARRGLDEVAGAWAARARREAADFNFEGADAALREARAAAGVLGTSSVDLDEVERDVAAARRVSQRVQAPGGDRLSPAQRERRLVDWLERAEAARARGDLLTPPGDSAYDRLAAARALAPDDPRVREATARMLPTAVACFDDALRGNQLVGAGRCLEASAVLGMDGAAQAAARERLAQRWVAVGDERLGAGELARADAAIAAARALDPQAPGLDDLVRRFRAASIEP
ncbi:hypothetical protein [Marilutibacter spongiae]|uniref:Tetratricopeptide repeat protein n=1 Tax=Marilutibacter spongiae TaxID=2025720 RepID=A0A7W3TIY1_9GAMM|nr:hypothetical protein [Lysobacter spongiae]MBB1059195.1 hypothetical protein [Lysobacter spongiae]